MESGYGDRVDSRRNLSVSADIENGIAEADIIFLSVNTPTKTFGDGAGSMSTQSGSRRCPGSTRLRA